MKPKDLAKVWDAPDNSKLTPKQISLRLPLMVSAKISALCDMYPRKTKTEIIGDLLATALDQFEEGLESEKGGHIGREPSPPDGDLEDIFEDVGTRGRYWRLTQKHLKEVETEAGIEDHTKIEIPFITEPIETNIF